jgi:ribonuclease HI
MAIKIPEGDTFAAYTDGACSGNPGPGGFAYLIQVAPEAEWDGRKMGWGSEPKTTNNRMELRAAIACLQHLGADDRGTIHSDSQYVVKGLNEWRAGWEKKGKLRDGADTPNLELWQKLFAIRDQRPNVRFAWVKGHADSEANNEVDRLAVKAAAEQLPDTRARSKRAADTEPPRVLHPLYRDLLVIVEDRLGRLRALGENAQAMVEEIAAEFGAEGAADYLFAPAPSLGTAPIAFLETDDPEQIAVVRLSIERRRAGAYA